MSDVPPSKDMAEQDTHQYTADVNEGETQPPSLDHASASKQEELDIAEVEHSDASSSASTNREAKDDNGEDKEQTGVKNDDSVEEEIVPLTEGSSPDGDSTLPVEDNSTPPQVDNGSCGDYNRETKEQQAVVVEEITSECFYQSDDGSDLQIQENTPSTETSLSQEISEEKEMDTEAIDQRNNVQTIGATTQKMTEPTVSVVTGSPGGSGRFLITVSIVVVVAVAILVQHLLQPESPPQKDDVRQIDIFLAQMDKLKTQFPNQRAELWKRSKIHLLRHLQMAQPTEPVSLILTAGVRAEKTLRCLAQGLASAFSSPLNASVLHIDGASKASEDSDQVKLDIDSKLQGAFEGDKPVAVIHRFEELPPGSTLIFYRYCDHENAAYKKTFLIFTVLLGEEEEIPAKSRLSTVEEMVDDHLQKKFLSDGHPVSFDRMDLDKYGGLWSRISHLILPVAAEERMELEGCSGT